MNRRWLTLLGILLGLGMAWYLVWRAVGERAPSPGPAAPASDGTTDAAAPAPRSEAAGETSAGGGFLPPAFDEERDPEGELRLEGQVLDERGLPVGGALVSIDTHPGRLARTEADGSFTFDRLVGRFYRLTARAGQSVGGPLRHWLSPKSDPCILQLRTGAEVEVSVVAADGGSPVVGAVVELRSIDEQPGLTGVDGVARLVGVPSGFAVLAVSADGFAPAHQALDVPAGAQTLRSRVALVRGAPLTGRVVDEDKRAVEGARVLAVDAGALLEFQDDERDGVLSDSAGRFRFPGLRPGSYRLVALHENYPPASVGPIAVAGGNRPAADVQIVLHGGAVLAGVVETEAGSPAPWVRIRVSGLERSAMPGPANAGRFRQATSDAEGRFRFSGLRRERVQVLASSERASSDVAQLDLAVRPQVEDLRLRLKTTATIEGLVVDGQGREVPEATVLALPDVLAGAPAEELELRGAATAVSDGAGRFVLGALAEGGYRLRASRSAGDHRAMLRPGVPARAGDHEVRLVVEAEGRLKGRLVFADGGTPKHFTIAFGYPPGAPFDSPDGSFALSGAPAGTHLVIVRGPEFAELRLSDVTITEDKETDLGTLRLDRGRQVSGRVVREDGQGVSGATVVVAAQLVGDGDRMALELGELGEQRMGIRRAISGADGGFTVVGVETARRLVVADHPELGRSAPVELPEGSTAPPLELVLHGWGRLEGRVTAGGQPTRAMVQINPKGMAEQMQVVSTAEDGSFVVERLPAGEHRLTAALVGGGGMNVRSEGRMIQLRAGETLRVDIDVPAGSVTLRVQLRGQGGANIDLAQALLFKGAVQATVATELNQAAMSAGGGLAVGLWTPSAPASFQQVVPGEYSLCLVPLNGDMNDPAFVMRLQKNKANLKVYCRPLVVEAQPAEQSLTVEVPPMDPLPPEPAPDAGP